MTSFEDKTLGVDDIHDLHENTPSNRSGNKPFADILKEAPSRRLVLQGSLAAAAAGFLAPAAIDRAQAAMPGTGGRVTFKPLSIADATADPASPSISDDYTYQVLIPWGTPIEPGIVREFTGDPNNRPTSEEAELQVGIGHDGMWFFPNDNPGRRARTLPPGRKAPFNFTSNDGMLCVNHEFGRTPTVIGKPVPTNLEEVRVMQAVHGVSVVRIARGRDGIWNVMPSKNARRITVNTPVAFSGPVENSPLLDNPNGNIPLGTVNNCGSGPTPWGTYLTCEENFNGYFGANDPAWTPTTEQDRYGFTSGGFGYGWHVFDKRFDLSDADYVNEQNRFGWIVEIDPKDAGQKPTKRTALGRFKHEAVAIAESGNGRIAAYMGDDQRFDYCYKYVSDNPWKQDLANGESPLDNGRLYVARFNADGTGEWLELTINNPVLSARFASQDEVLVYARVAADLLGATPMDRPEWTTIGEDQTVFWTLTNNSNRQNPNAANPQAPNPDGHIIRTKDSNDFLGTTFTWDIYILASDTRGTENVFTDPDAAYSDGEGRLFIGTDGGQPDGLNNQLVVFDTTLETPQPVRLLTGVEDDEITGWAVTPDGRTAFTNSQHPGNGDPSVTNFPAPRDGVTIPRDCTLIITRKSGGIVGY